MAKTWILTVFFGRIVNPELLAQNRPSGPRCGAPAADLDIGR
jgi:hypothetical protein